MREVLESVLGCGEGRGRCGGCGEVLGEVCGGGKGRCGSEEKFWVTCWSVGKVGEMWGCGKVCRGVG